MKLHTVTGFPNPVRVEIALAERGLSDAVERREVDVMKGEHRAPAFRRLNPFATVPALELADGTVINECSAITEYLDGQGAGPSLTGRTALDRARIASVQRQVEANVLEAVGAFFHHATPGLGPDLETNQNPAFGTAQKARALAALAWVDEHLSDGRPWLAGEAYSVADVTLFAGIAFAEFAEVEIDPGLTHLAAWRARIAARPAVARVTGAAEAA